MPNARKKKAAKMEDFKKKKLKVGKKKAVPDSYTDTSFKSKSVVLPNQSITEDKSHEVTTKRNLTMSDLVAQLRHYNSGVKKDALAGLTELCNGHPQLLASSLGLVVNGLLKLFIDDDHEVRKATYKFLNETFTELHRVDLQPFMPLLIMYTCSAMTHIFEDVRLDAVKLMDLWIKMTPDIVVSKFWNRITGNYMSLLTVDSNSVNTSSSTGAMLKITSSTNVNAAVNRSHLQVHKSKLRLLQSLSLFLEAGLSTPSMSETESNSDHREEAKDPFWFLYNYLELKHARESFIMKMAQYHDVDPSKTVIWRKTLEKNAFTPIHPMASAVAPFLSTPGSDLFNYSHLNLFESSGPRSQSNNTNTVNTATKASTSSADLHMNEFSMEDRMKNIKELIETFQPILIASWLEAAPSVFMSVSNISHTPALKLIYAILKLSLVMWRAMVGSDNIKTLSLSWLQTQLESLLKHFTVYFPFGADAIGNRGNEVEDMLLKMNIMACELTSLYLLARTMIQNNTENNRTARRRMSKKAKLDKNDDTENEIDRVPEWAEPVVEHILGALGSDREGNTVSTSTHFKAEHLMSLLPAIWGFLNCLNYEESILLMKATIHYYHSCQPTSASKRVLLNFIIRIFMLQSMAGYNGHFRILKYSALASLLEEWFLSLPKLLWQLRTHAIESSRAILNFMCDIAKRGDKDIFSQETLLEAETKLIPFFFVNVASKGPLYGPFLELPADIQQRALDYVFYLNSKADKVISAIDRCREKQLPAPIGLY
ncbi:Rix1 complex component [Mycotypha africana]|uniref:Rix1 complex component n=1 Tax=Mycotypha africana TaxID=64632 RepID=UPI0023003356|nr:Rix1 complex component [Mycotypha africana]KAI8971431.1 Rix1 complex component [Mycotypha africana]